MLFRSLFSDQIIRFVTQLANEMIQNNDLIYFVYQLFVNMQFVTNDPRYLELVNFMYNHVQSISAEISKMPNIHRIVRIFMKFGKYENLDKLCFHLCSSDFYNIEYLVYELSFILINQNNFYSNESIANIINLIFEIYKSNPPCFIKPIVLIFARVALSSRKRIIYLLQSNLSKFLNEWINYSVIQTNSFKNYLELQKKLMIAFFMMFVPRNPNDPNAQKMARIVKRLVCILVECVKNELSEDKIFSQ